MANPNPSFLDPDAISRAEALGLHARYIVEGYMAGEHKSPYRGFAIEFAQAMQHEPFELWHVVVGDLVAGFEVGERAEHPA